MLPEQKFHESAKKKRDGGGDGGVSALEEQQLGGGEQSPAPGIEKEQLEAAGGSLGRTAPLRDALFPVEKQGNKVFPGPQLAGRSAAFSAVPSSTRGTDMGWAGAKLSPPRGWGQLREG